MAWQFSMAVSELSPPAKARERHRLRQLLRLSLAGRWGQHKREATSHAVSQPPNNAACHARQTEAAIVNRTAAAFGASRNNPLR
mmetsp:Transcript_53624/g.116571  ORF Transcript_53624/g.116571 Transcript_53624/m.116571 type:complete len:84 (+) Transcript_53624:1-252(+)